MKTLLIIVGIVCTVLVASVTMGADVPTIKWSGVDVKGQKAAVPVDGRVSVVAFVRADQSQSKEALATLKKAVTDAAAAQIVVIVSGQSADEQAKTLASSGQCPWPIVADSDFAASGKMGVHVWPTTLIVRADGEQAGHLAGMPISYASDLQAYLEFAAGKLDAAALQTRLNNHEVVQDDAAQAAHRRYEVGLRLHKSGELEQSREQLQQALKLQPNDARIRIALADVFLAMNDAKQAAPLLQAIPDGAVPSWQLNLLRGKALIQQEKWDDAKKLLGDALRLNPDPSEAHYLLGVAQQGTGDTKAAAEEFRKAYETVSTTRKSGQSR